MNTVATVTQKPGWLPKTSIITTALGSFETWHTRSTVRQVSSCCHAGFIDSTVGSWGKNFTTACCLCLEEATIAYADHAWVTASSLHLWLQGFPSFLDAFEQAYGVAVTADAIEQSWQERPPEPTYASFSGYTLLPLARIFIGINEDYLSLISKCCHAFLAFRGNEAYCPSCYAILGTCAWPAGGRARIAFVAAEEITNFVTITEDFWKENWTAEKLEHTLAGIEQAMEASIY